jgi:NADPH-dependent curcumin reductase CurA
MQTNAWVIDRPATGAYEAGCLRWVTLDLPPLSDGQILVRNLYASLDPTSRNWLKLEPHNNPFGLQVGAPMGGQNIAVVEASRDPAWQAGDLVTGFLGWQELEVTKPDGLSRIEPHPDIPLAAHLTIFSHIGRAASMGLLAVGQMKASDTVLVSGAAGATGCLAAQIAKARGCRTVGIAGGAEKCAWLRDTLGLDGVVDYRGEDVATALRNLCPDGVDLYFDNVGGPLLDVVLTQMAIGCRIVVCGAMSQYDLASPEAAYGVKNLPMLLFRSARMEGFVVPQFIDRYAEFDLLLRALFLDGKLLHRPHIVRSLGSAPEALKLLFEGRNEGKLMVQVSDLPHGLC